MQQRFVMWAIMWLQVSTILLMFHRFYVYQNDRDLAPATTFSVPSASQTEEPVENRDYQTKEKTRLSRLERLSNYDKSVFQRLDQLIAKKASSQDPELIQLVKELLDPPAVTHPVKLSRYVYKTPQAEAVDAYLNGMTGGFFVEVGGYDGERSSNSIYFEVEKKWKGVLIEADPFFYTQLMGKNRRCWSINACLSPNDYVSKLAFKGSHTGQGRVVLEKETKKKQEKNKSIDLFSENMVIPCFPLETILFALKQTKVDFFSLDVEGVELEILKTIDFNKIDIRTLAVEFAHGNKADYRSFMKTEGYTVYKEINVVDPNNFLYAHDFIFVRANSTIT